MDVVDKAIFKVHALNTHIYESILLWHINIQLFTPNKSPVQAGDTQ